MDFERRWIMIVYLSNGWYKLEILLFVLLCCIGFQTCSEIYRSMSNILKQKKENVNIYNYNEWISVKKHSLVIELKLKKSTS